MDVIIRKATEQDYPGLAKLWDDLNYIHSDALPDIFMTPQPTPQSLEYVRYLLSNEKASIFVAEDQGEIIGLIQPTIREAPDNPVTIKRSFVSIDDICVAKPYRRTSVGKALMIAAERWGQEKGMKWVELRVWDFNRNAMVFYKSLGYCWQNHIMWKTIGK
jgi:diamine N-acetyltransferase